MKNADGKGRSSCVTHLCSFDSLLFFHPGLSNFPGEGLGSIKLKGKVEKKTNRAFCSLCTKAEQQITQKSEWLRTKIVIVVGCFSFCLLPFLLHLGFLNWVAFSFRGIFILGLKRGRSADLWSPQPRSLTWKRRIWGRICKSYSSMYG